MSHVFISYSIKDSAFANSFADELRNQGFDVWIDSGKLRAGETWWISIVSAIWECSAFVVILSPNSDASQWVQREIRIADHKQKPWFPLLLSGDLERPNWQIFLGTQYEDVRSGQLPSASFYETLAKAAERKTVPGINVTAKVGSSAASLSDPAAQEFIKDPPPPPAISATEAEISGAPAAAPAQSDSPVRQPVTPAPIPISVPSSQTAQQGSTSGDVSVPGWQRWVSIGAVALFVLVIVGIIYLQKDPSIFHTSSDPTAGSTSVVTSIPTATADIPTAAPDTPIPVNNVSQTETPEATETQQIAVETAVVTEPPSSVLLDVPYASQWSSSANFARNDDQPATLYMVLQWYAHMFPDSATASAVKNITVNDVSRAAGMGANDPSVSFSQLITAARSYHLPIAPCQTATLDRVLAELDARRPVLILVNYKTLLPEQTYNGIHAVLVIGYDASNVTLFDSNYRYNTPDDAAFRVTRDQFSQAISEANNRALFFSADAACPA